MHFYAQQLYFRPSFCKFAVRNHRALPKDLRVKSYNEMLEYPFSGNINI